MRRFGWEDDIDLGTKLYDAYMKQTLKFQQTVHDGSDKCINQFRKEIILAVHQTYYPHLEATLDARLPIIEDMLDLALVISTTALASLFLEDSTNSDIAEHNSYITFGLQEDRTRFIQSLIGRFGIPFKRFYESIFACLFCVNSNIFVGDEVVVAREGLVLYPIVLLSPTLDQQGGLNLTLHRGAIRWDQLDHQRYQYVREILHGDIFVGTSKAEIEPIRAFSGSKYQGLVPKADWLTQPPEHFALSSIKGDSILIKPTLRIHRKREATSQAPIHQTDWKLSIFDNTPRLHTRYSDALPCYQVHFSYLNALKGLTCALYVPRSGAFSTRAEQNLAKQLRRELEKTYWLCPSSQRREVMWGDLTKIDQNKKRFIVNTDRYPILALYRLSILTGGLSRYVLVENGCNLVQAIQCVEKEWDSGWVVVM